MLSARRIKVSSEIKVTTAAGEKTAMLVAISAQSALILSDSALAERGEIFDIALPGVAGASIAVTAGVESVEKVKEGVVTVAEFMIDQQAVRQALDELLRLLLDGDGGGRRKQPRITHEIPMSYGEQGEHAGILEEISLAGMGMRAFEALTPGSQVKVLIPDGHGGVRLRMRGVVANLRPSEVKPGEFLIGIAWISPEPAALSEIRVFLSELVRS